MRNSAKLRANLLKVNINQVVQKAELLETKLNNITAVENSRKACQWQVNKVLKTGSILYSKDMQYMVQNCLELEGKREKKKEEA